MPDSESPSRREVNEWFRLGEMRLGEASNWERARFEVLDARLQAHRSGKLKELDITLAAWVAAGCPPHGHVKG